MLRYPYQSGDYEAPGGAEVIATPAGRRRPLDARPRILARRRDALRLDRLENQCRRRQPRFASHEETRRWKRRKGLAPAAARSAAAHWCRASIPRARPQAFLRRGPAQLLRLDDPAGQRRTLVRRQRARHARRQPAARLRDAGRRRAPSMAGPGITSAPTKTRATRASGPISLTKPSTPDVLIQPHSARRSASPFTTARSSRRSTRATPSSRCTAHGTAPNAPATRSSACALRTASRPANTRISSPASSSTTAKSGAARST